MSEGRLSSAAAYAGDIAPGEAWTILKENPQARLIDVRTRAEWNFVGLPDLAETGTQALLAEWQVFPDMAVNAQFAEQAAGLVTKSGGAEDAPVILLCRSGVRSRAAAIALAARGFTAAYNIAGGFEGDHDADGHRGQLNGWKAEGLPWRQG
ncbi:Thiosulfate sulfurtransferase GlpE [Alphaproteobacteria bacterium SO-S41]|nr:Thiosulfate sulfurtransferase GlpE [Alphaproteobacteria bacterium SO-S41]